MFLHSLLYAVFRTILKTHNLAPGDFPEIQSFAVKLNDVKFTDFANFSQKQIDELDMVLNVEIPKLMSVRPIGILVGGSLLLFSISNTVVPCAIYPIAGATK